MIQDLKAVSIRGYTNTLSFWCSLNYIETFHDIEASDFAFNEMYVECEANILINVWCMKLMLNRGWSARVTGKRTKRRNYPASEAGTREAEFREPGVFREVYKTRGPRERQSGGPID